LEDPKQANTVLDQVLKFSWAYGTLAYLAGQRDGFRFGAAATTRATSDQSMVIPVIGALVDDRQLDRLIGQLATGKEDPEYIN
jgi:hypothetical protein